MKAASGKANPKRVNESLKRALDVLETENAN
jgi:Asp-tRNA(Asn)/Glu-tRNA(Gln) amidotransferase B subunit